MPLLLVVAVVLGVMLVAILLTPVALVQRYRVGTARRAARSWVATINLLTLGLSASLFLVSAAVTSIWVPGALKYALLGMAAGCLLGVLGLLLTRWEATAQGMFYTPNRLLVLAITLVVTARIAYGFWRGWDSWRTGIEGGAWFVAAGVAGSLAAGAVVIGYYLTYWAGVRLKTRL